VKTNNTIYTIPTKVGNIETVHIETVVTRGLYRFSILGINQREASDTRDRVYSALRSTDVFNLKSDNRKITVNIIPSYKLEYSRVYDLAVALSCLQAVGRFDIDEKVLVIGELSICGNILCSKQLLQTIFIAIRDNIKIIICGEEDIDCIQADIVDIIRKNNINLCVAKNIRELLQRISKKEWCVFASKTERGLIPDRDYTVNMKRLELNILSNEIVMLMYIALCGGHDIVFETPNSVFIGDFISDI
jgi:predicted ATPase with chaperone activity